jgi:hypothetical protein
MATYWIDPFLEATTQGAGTTDTSTKDGSYAAPFSLNDFISTSNSAISTINGTSLSDGDELRMKGIAFSTLFGSEGNVYGYHTVGTQLTTSYLYPVTGNSTFDATSSDTTSNLFAFQNSDIASYLPNWSHPLFFAGNEHSTSSRVSTLLHSFIYPVIHVQMGHSSASSTGIELFRVKDEYANIISYSSSHHYSFNISVKVTLSAGWTSETEQNGYSIFEVYGSTNFRYFYINSASATKIKYDCERLIFCQSEHPGAASYQGLYAEFHESDARGEATDHVFPIFALNFFYITNWYYGGYSGDTCVFPMITGGLEGYDSYIRLFPSSTSGSGATTTFKNFISGQCYLNFLRSYSNHAHKLGNMYAKAYDDSSVSGTQKLLRYSTSYLPTTSGNSVTYLQNSVYCALSSSDSYDIVLDNLGGTVVYESGLKNPGLAPLASVVPGVGTYGDYLGPVMGGVESSESSSLALFNSTKTINASQNWYDPKLTRDGIFDPITYTSFGKFILGGSNYKTTAHNVGFNVNSALSSTAAPQFLVASAEHNDYDGKPVSLIGDPYTAGTQFPALMYNDTVSSTDVLVGQWCGTTTGNSSTQSWIPLDLAVPSYTAGSDDLRAKVVVAYADGSSNSAAGSILLRAWHRDTTQTGNFRVYSSSATAVSAGGDPSSPTTVTLNLSNVPTSGQEDITSVCLGIRLDFASNTNIQKYYIVSADIETY